MYLTEKILAGPQTGQNGPKIKNCITGRAGKRNYGPGRAEKYSHFTISSTYYIAKLYVCRGAQWPSVQAE